MGDGRRVGEDGGSPGGGFHGLGEPICPFFARAGTDWLYPVTGYCRGRPDGKLMIPSVAEYRDFCTTERYRSCRYRGNGQAIKVTGLDG
ncbi:hypothetical protein [Candidatus Methylomirabilis sp.]|uniref:hypothetical protein n=1 Tax=Candidatus Methylomirabilis sp. TaxID=2032687 RepID=UPI002A600A93|nr:hypothetical protein [Candidatus Methylomirabilis sp.]